MVFLSPSLEWFLFCAKKLHNLELRNLWPYFLLDSVMVIKKDEIDDACGIQNFTNKIEWMRLFEVYRCKWEENIKMFLKDSGFEAFAGVFWFRIWLVAGFS